MEVSGLRLLFLIAATASVLPGCAWFGRNREAAPEPVAAATQTATTGDAPTDRPIIEPQGVR